MAFLKNSWYCAGWVIGPGRTATRPEDHRRGSRAVPEERAGRGGGPLPASLRPPARGKVVGDHIECPYHGLQFNGHGQCAHNPHSSAIPRSAREVLSAGRAQRRLLDLDGRPQPGEPGRYSCVRLRQRSQKMGRSDRVTAHRIQLPTGTRQSPGPYARRLHPRRHGERKGRGLDR
jgi:hypothetical protein